MTSLKSILLPISISLLSFQTACAPVDILNTLTPSQSFKLSQDQSYGALPRQSLDIYSPQIQKPNAPIIFFVYGGGWDSGTKDIYKFIGQAFSAAGYTTIIPDYRIYPDVTYPSFVEDVALAAAWTHENFEAPMMAIGHSAGAHIASLLALRPDFLAAQDLKACDVFSGWIGLAGPYDFKVWEEPYLSIFAKDLRAVDIQPISYAANSTLPALIATGANDKTVDASQSQRMVEALRAAGTSVTHKVYEDTDHIAVMARLSKLLRKKGSVYDDVIAFIEGLPAKTECKD